MTIKEILKAKADLLRSAPEAYFKRLDRVQLQVFDEVVALMNKLETKDGLIKLTQKNLRIADEINGKLKDVLIGSDFDEAVTQFASEFNTQRDLNVEYFKDAFPEFKPTKLQDEIFKKTKVQAIEQLAASTPETGFLQGIKDLINDNVQAGGSFKDAVKSLREYALGGDQVDGKLLKYSKQVAYDSMATSDRAFTSAIADELDSEWFLYAGGEIETSREFCKERHEKYFHYLEVESWAALDWDGKNQETNKQTIFIFAGGWQCRHNILPVSVFSVPKDVIQRNIDNGNYKPSEEELALVMG